MRKYIEHIEDAHCTLRTLIENTVFKYLVVNIKDAHWENGLKCDIHSNIDTWRLPALDI